MPVARLRVFGKLRRLSPGHGTTIQTRFGAMRVQRLRGYGRCCRKWRLAADAVLGLPEAGKQSVAAPVFVPAPAGASAGGRPVVLSQGCVMTRG